jgi:phosphate transport system protein
MSEHIDQELGHQLESLRERLLRMAGVVEKMIDDSVTSLIEENVQLAQQTIQRDQTVNRLEVEADELCLRILARWQPVASDLRFLTIALKMVTDLERIGDLAVNICERTLEFSFRHSHLRASTLEEMTKITREMVHHSVDAFLNSSDVIAQQVIDTDDKVDALYERGFAEVMGVMQRYPEDLKPGIHALSVIKWVERIADHATNLAELVVFMVRGKDIRHMSPEQATGKLTR